jgi:hypothetical protein
MELALNAEHAVELAKEMQFCASAIGARSASVASVRVRADSRLSNEAITTKTEVVTKVAPVYAHAVIVKCSIQMFSS